MVQPNGIANIVSLSEVAKKHRITMDSSIDNAIYVHKEDGSMRRFIRMYEVRNLLLKPKREQLRVQHHHSRRTRKEVLRIGCTTGQEGTKAISERGMLDMIDNSLSRGSTVSRRDVYMANDIYGANTNSLKGKTVRKTEGHV